MTSFCEVHTQVHVVLKTQGHDPILMRTLQETASSLSWLNAVYSPSANPWLTETMKHGCEDPSSQQQAVRVVGGALTSANQGSTARHTLHVVTDHLRSAVNTVQCILTSRTVRKVRATAGCILNSRLFWAFANYQFLFGWL